MLRPLRTALVALVVLSCAPAADTPESPPGAPATYGDLLTLFQEWRAFEPPPLVDGAPDYRPETNAARQEGLGALQRRLATMDPSGWPVSQQVDYHLVRAEMNGMDFHLRVLRPFARDPAYYASVRTYQSDTPAEEGPTIHFPLRLWEYSVWPRTVLDQTSPLPPEQEERLLEQLRGIPPLLEQARGNLAESNAQDLWVGGIRAFEDQSAALSQLVERLEQVGQATPELVDAVQTAQGATETFAGWLEQEAPTKTGPSGLGRRNYTWFLRNVLLVPMSWEEEVAVTRRELARSHASLRLEESRNQYLPQLPVAMSEEEFQEMQDAAILKYLRFMEDHGILTMEPWMERALRERVPSYSPPATRNFFAQATHRDPLTLWTHLYHWWDTARMQAEPHASPIRREPLLYNVWMSRSEGMATVMEEWMMHAGLYDDNPRSREIVWVMLAARAARGLGSLYAHSNDLTMEEAGDLHVDWTPRGWMRRDLDLLGFEQHLYLRQPGYGPSYVTGGRLLEETMAQRARQLGDDFRMRTFFDEINAAGLIPVSLIHWEVTGDDRMIRELLDDLPPQPFQ
ncbi:MAG: DUF885 family protein [Gemmatimonadota bacterium]